MGRKSSAKSHARSASAPPPIETRRSFPPLLVVALLAVVVVAAAAIIYIRRGDPASATPEASQSAQSQTPPPAPFAEVPEINQRPHPDAKTPPLPFLPTPPARPMETVRAVYKFAAEHPEVLSYQPCYCGCERSGHRGNTDCFVTARAENGDVLQWEPHGMT